MNLHKLSYALFLLVFLTSAVFSFAEKNAVEEGNTALINGEFKKAKFAYELALKEAKQLNNTKLITEILLNKTQVQYKLSENINFPLVFSEIKKLVDEKNSVEYLAQLYSLQAEYHMANSRRDIAAIYCDSAEQYAEFTENPRVKVILLRNKSKLAQFSSEYSRALLLADAAISLSGKSNLHYDLVQSVHLKSAVYNNMGDMKNAFEYLLLAFKLSARYHLNFQRAYLYNHLGMIYTELGRTKKAETALLNAINLGKKNEDSYIIAQAFGNLAALYTYQDMSGFKPDSVYQLRTKAVDFLQGSIRYQESVDQVYGLSSMYVNLGKIYFDLNKIQEARKEIEKGLQISEKENDYYGMAMAYGHLGDTYYGEKKYNETIKYYKRALEYHQFTDNKLYVANQTELLAKTYDATGNFDSSYHYALVLDTLNAEIYSFQNRDEISKITKKIEEDEIKYENTLAEIKADKLLIEKSEFQLKTTKNYYLLVLLLLVMAAGAMAIFYFKQKKIEELKNKEAELNLKLLSTQMNPHFIFNCLVGVKNSIANNDIEGAADYLKKIIRLIDYSVKASVNGEISLKEEVSFLSQYLDVQKVRHDNRFNYFIKVSPDIDPLKISIPPILFQPYVENAIEHGVTKKAGNDGGIINIDIRIEKNKLISEIADNGPGMNQPVKQKVSAQDHLNVSTELTKERLHNLSLKHKKNYNVRYEDKPGDAGNMGTKVIIELPLILS